MRWAGVDVGGERKGFDVAVIEALNGRLLLTQPPSRLATAREVASMLQEMGPSVVAVDSPVSPAPPGLRSRQEERDLARDVCGIRYTPDQFTLDKNEHGYYGWILNGLALYAALSRHQAWEVVECFPTASWTRLGGGRGKQTRARWSSKILRETLIGNQELEGVPARLNQDARDAIVAAFTALLYSQKGTQGFGAIVVPNHDR